MRQTGAQIIDCRPLCRAADFVEQVVGERHAGHCGTRLQTAMQVRRHVSNLDHHRHAKTMIACAAHVKPWAPFAGARLQSPRLLDVCSNTRIHGQRPKRTPAQECRQFCGIVTLHGRRGVRRRFTPARPVYKSGLENPIGHMASTAYVGRPTTFSSSATIAMPTGLLSPLMPRCMITAIESTWALMIATSLAPGWGCASI